MAVIMVIFVLNDSKFSPRMYQINEHINSSNKKNRFYDKTRKIIVNLSSNTSKNNNNSTCQLNHLQNFLLMSIVDTLKIIYQMLIRNYT